MTFWKEETLKQQSKHLQATTRWQGQTPRMPPHFTNLACWSANQLAKPTQTHLLEFEVNVCTNLNPHCQIKGWKTFWQEANSRKPNKVLVKLESLRATNSCHDGYMFTRLNKFLKDLHVDWLVDPPGIWLLDILGRWFPADKSFLIVQKRAWLNWSRISRFLHLAVACPFSDQEPAWSLVSRSYLGMGHPYTKSAWLPETDTRWAFNWRRPLQV